MDANDRHEVALNVAELAEAVRLASLNFDVWWVYTAKDSRNQYIGAMNKYPTFFRMSIHAHVVAIVIALYRIFETRKDTYNVRRLVALLEENHVIAEPERAKVNQLLREAQPPWRKITIVRSDVFAHRKKGSTVEQSFKKAHLSPNEMRHLIELSKDIVNTLSHAFDRSSFAFNLNAEGDTKRMLDALR